MPVKIKPGNIKVTFDLPEWFPPARTDYMTMTHYPKGHIFAGQTLHIKDAINNSGNRSMEALTRMKGIEVFSNIEGSWVCVDFSPGQNIPARIKDFQAKLQRFLNRFKESN